jgi:hypothetical protein
MYTRAMSDPPETLVKDGKPIFGTFSGHPSRLDIRGVENPYGIFPLPVFITNFRIKSRLSFFFNIGEYIGCIDFFDAKVFGFADVCFWNQNTKQRFAYQTVLGPRHRLIPHELQNPAAIVSYKKSRYIRISWDRKLDKLSVIFNLEGDDVRPSSNAALISHFQNQDTAEITTVIPAPTMRRCAANTLIALSIHGAVTLTAKQGSPKTMPDANGTALFDMSRTFFRFRTRGEFLSGMGMVDGKQVSFRIAAGSQDAINPDQYNNNVLFFAGKVTPLPAVTITHPFGTMNKWVIQDTENMVDLTFTPIAENMHTISVFIVRTQYHTIYGTFEGVLLNSSGEKVALHALPGLAKKYLIRL